MSNPSRRNQARHPFLAYLLNCLFIALGVAAAAYTSSGISYDSYQTLAIACLLVGVLNSFLRPLLILFTLPFVIFTLGLGIFVINAGLIYLVASWVKGFQIASFWSALWAAVLVSIVGLVFNSLFGRPGGTRGGGARLRYSATVRGPDGKVRRVTHGHEAEPGGPDRRIGEKRRRRKDGEDDVIDV